MKAKNARRKRFVGRSFFDFRPLCARLYLLSFPRATFFYFYSTRGARTGSFRVSFGQRQRLAKTRKWPRIAHFHPAQRVFHANHDRRARARQSRSYRQPALLRAPDWNKRLGAVAAINGGYFDNNSHAIGLRIAQGKRTNPFYARANWGVFAIRDDKAFIAHTRDYKGSPRTREALQCGPRLVVDGRVTDLKQQWARRSGVGVDVNGKVIIAVSDGALSFDDWAAMWADKNALGCRDALNLDGGPSTQMSVISAKHPVEVRGGWPVPDAILVR